MELSFQDNEECSAVEVAELFRSSGIRRPIDDLERIQRMIAHADEILTVRDGKLVGIVRAVTDYAYCCYISDLAVDRDYQGMGIGRQLIERLKKKLGEEEIQYVLTSAPKAVGFYEKIGFERADKAFVIKRKKN
ncbi:GNAT family N-acetyltransferase [Paenibacillus vulneris]|uniref:GNAT family N-acetyltransferase n=1 Tax=Paenibacillus vulneris TaxID=1133364 RepID=A0ABW3UYF4_9BACL